MLSALYYPFSRCIDAAALKQLLLVFDSVTFLDPVRDDTWRAKLYRDLEVAEDSRFQTYRHLEEPLAELRREGVIRLQHPAELDALDTPETTAGAISDLDDPVWCAIAGTPRAYGLPHRTLDSQGRPTWQIFESKFPVALRRALSEEERLRRHVVSEGDRIASWTVSYEAGSAAALNLHLAAAHELSLAPVTDSSLHHRLLLRKLTRSLTPDSDWQAPPAMSLNVIVNQTAVQLIEDLLPRSALSRIGFESILEFREKTRTTRLAMAQQLEQKLAPVASLSRFSDIAAAQAAIMESLTAELRSYRADLAAVRDNLWSDVVKATTVAVTGGTAAVALQSLVHGAYYVLAASIGGSAFALLQAALSRRAEKHALERKVSPVVAYLSTVAELGAKR